MLGVLFNTFGYFFGTKLAVYSENYHLGKYKNMHVHPHPTQLFCIKSLKFFQTEMSWMEYLKCMI